VVNGLTYQYQAQVIDVHDGDTVKVMVPLLRVNKGRKPGTLPRNLGFHVYVELVPWLDAKPYATLHAPMRFLGLNAPELATPAGKTARDYLLTLISVGDVITIRSSVAAHEVDPDKFGDRWDAVLVRKDGLNVNDAMVASGHALPWDGQGVKPK
jgi:endonuclease YncB( thermonuclease family)